MNQLDIMLDDVNQPEMEIAYRKTHKKLFQKMNQYLVDYRTVKERGFKKLSSILNTDEKTIAIVNPQYKLKTSGY